MRFVFTFVREKVKFVREKSVKCQGISRGPVCGNHVIADCEFSTGPGTNTSGILVGPVQKLVYFSLD